MKRFALACLVTLFVALPIASDALALSPQEMLGKALYKDVNLSINRNQSCETCHHPTAGFADPANTENPYLSPVSQGSKPDQFGGRNAPTAAYAGFSPVMYYDPIEGLFIGGTFWDGRASGLTLGDPLAEQALGPFLNPVEMAMPQESGDPLGKAVVDRVLESSYKGLFKKVCGNPKSYSQYEEAYNCVGRAISAYERTKELVKFSSRFDKFWAEQRKDVSSFGTDSLGNYVGVPQGFKSKHLDELELKGLALFNAADKGNCAACHPTANSENGRPMLTDFTYDNLGMPVNPRIAELAGKQPTDYGLGAKVALLKEVYAEAGGNPNDLITEYPEGKKGPQVVSDEMGKHKVSCLRNAGVTAPYGHNGLFATLEDIVHFYNTRDVKKAGWDPPEVPQTVNADELGNLGLNRDEELAIAAFIKTLTDE